MKTHMYGLRDLKAEVFCNSFEDINDQTAMRKMQMIKQANPDLPYIKFCTDFQLYHLGTLDTKTGEFSNELHHVVDLHALVGDDVG